MSANRAIDWLSSKLGFIWKVLEFFIGKSGKSSDVEVGRNVIIGSKNVINQTFVWSSDLKKQVDNMDTTKDKTLEKMKTPSGSIKPTPKPESEDYKKVITLINEEPFEEPTEDKKKKLKALFYTSTDGAAQIQIIIALASWFDLLEEENRISDFVGMFDRGIGIANLIGAKGEKAILLAYKGKFVSMQFSKADLNAVFNIQISNAVGIPLLIEDEKQIENERQNVIRKLHELDKLSQNCFAEAERTAIESKSYYALGYVCMLIGDAAGNRYIHLSKFAPERAEEEKRLCKKALLLAKDIYSAVGDELSTALSLHNLANQLRLFGETDEAKVLLEKVIEISKKHNNQQLLKKAQGLLERIISGRIPNYMGGEKF